VVRTVYFVCFRCTFQVFIRRFCFFPLSAEVQPDLLGELTGMGFSEVRSRKALHFTGNSNVAAALDWIMQHEDGW
jgi:UBA/TS-N domain